LANAITGNGGMNFLSGHDGSDNLLGLGGNDQLFGGNGDDILRGGTGVDVLTGNGGADRFIFDDLETAVGSRADRIADFSAAQGDLIDLSLIDANTTTLGDSFFTYLGGRPFQSGLAPGQLRYVADGADVILQGSTNTDTAAEFEIRLANLSTPPLTGNLLL
jgi:Ca2+-binding RTX toxin-like protein